MKDLVLILPIYNEESSIEFVINQWIEELNKYNIDYDIYAYNDGSKDNTANILKSLSEKYPNLKHKNKENSGHGPTILQGYRENCTNYKWIFQIDSDNEMSPDGFISLWTNRENYSFLIGIRDKRIQNFSRMIISYVSRFTVKLFYGLNGPYDVNCPYRLMKSEDFKSVFEIIPSDTFSPNIIISGFVTKNKIKFYETPVYCKPRQTGVISIQNFKLLKAAIKSFMQTIAFSFKL